MSHPHFQRAERERPQGRMKEQRNEQYAPQRSDLDNVAGQVARSILREAGLEDSARNWRALRDAFLAGVKHGRA